MTTTRWQLNNTTGGLWSTAGNWTGGVVPDAAGDFVTFDISDLVLAGGGAGTRAIDLGGLSRTVGFLNFQGDQTRDWNVTNGTIIMQPLGGNAFVSYQSLTTFGSSRVSATMQFNASVDFFVNGLNVGLRIGDITESGGARDLVKLGTGTLLLTGTSNYTGTTTITAGKLQVGDAGTTGTLGSGNVINNSTLVFARTDAITVNNVISGTGDVSIGTGVTGTVTLAAANTYTGITVAQTGGTLKLGNVNAVGGGGDIAVLANATLDFNGFQATGANTGAFFNRLFNPFLPTTGVVTNTSATTVDLVANNATDQVFAGQIQGIIHLIKQGANTLYLTGQNGFNGSGGFEITGGTAALLGNGSVLAEIFVGAAGTFDISGISGTSTTVGDISDNIFAPGAGGNVILGGKTLIVDTAFYFTSQAAMPKFTGTAGLSDGLVIKLHPAFNLPLNMSLTRYQFLNWEDGFDTITIMGNANSDSIIGSKFSDTILGGRDGLGAGDDSLDGALGDDILNGGNGNDKLTGGAGDDIIDGGANTDTASYETTLIPLGQQGVTVSLLLNGVAQNTKTAGLDTLTGIENVTGTTNGNDTLTGDAGANVLKGLGGNDTLEGGAGGDTLDPGTGIDTVSYASSNVGVTVNIAANTAANGHAAGDTLLAGFDNIIGSNFTDSLSGNNFNNVILGRDGVDNIFAALGNDTVNGGIGNDIIRGGGGADHLTGALGNDVFYYVAASEGGDTISDFRNLVGDNDVFRFLGSAFGALPAGALAANRFLADANGVATTADHRFIYETDTGILRYDADGNAGGAAIIIATVSGAPAITLSDFSIV